MDHLGTNSTAQLGPHSAPEPSAGSIPQSSQRLLPPPGLTKGSLDHPHDWITIGQPQGFYDEEGFLYPSCSLTSEKLKDRKGDDVVIFNYSLSRVDGDPLIEGSPPSSGSFGEDDIFSQVPKDRLIESDQFNQIINPTMEPRLIQSRARLGIM